MYIMFCTCSFEVSKFQGQHDLHHIWQGITMKPLVQLLKIKTKSTDEQKLHEMLNERVRNGLSDLLGTVYALNQHYP